MGIREELLAVQQASGDNILHASEAVSWAKKHPSSALHRALEWDNDRAADEYRLLQVRRLIKLYIINERHEPTVVSLSIDRPNGGGYRDVSDVMAVPDLREIMLRDALAELERVQKRYDSVKELADVWNAIKHVKSRAKKAEQITAAVA